MATNQLLCKWSDLPSICSKMDSVFIIFIYSYIHTHIYIYVNTVHRLYIQDLRCFASHLPAGIRTSTCCVSVQDTKTGLIVGAGTPNLENRLVWSPAILGGRLEVSLMGRTIFFTSVGIWGPYKK